AAVKPASTRTPAAAIKAAPTAPDAAAKPVAVPSVRAEWHKRLEQLPGRNRQPRGVARQAFI
ncbi:MAG TPA: hypothetical protein DC029_03690, partial [Pseudomonas sp.]|nr:hypothetical protein [Pseudomonas sp.]